MNQLDFLWIRLNVEMGGLEDNFDHFYVGEGCNKNQRTKHCIDISRLIISLFCLLM